MIYGQLGTDVEAMQLKKRYTQASGGITVSGTYDEVDPLDVRDLFFDDPAAKSDANRVVMLWKDNASIADPA